MAALSFKKLRGLSRALETKGEVERLEKKDLDPQDQEGWTGPAFPKPDAT